MKAGTFILVCERPDGQWSPSPEDHHPADYFKSSMDDFPVRQSPQAVLTGEAERLRIADELAQLSGRKMTFGELESTVASILATSKFNHFCEMQPISVAERIAEPIDP